VGKDVFLFIGSGVTKIITKLKRFTKEQSHALGVAIWPSSYVTSKQRSAFFISNQVCTCIYKNHAKLKFIATTAFSHTLQTHSHNSHHSIPWS